MNTRKSVLMVSLSLSLVLAANTPYVMAEGTAPVIKDNLSSPADSLSGLMGEYFQLKWVPVGGRNYVRDTVSLAHERYFSGEQSDESTYVSDPDHYKLFVPFTYYNSPIEQYSTLTSDIEEDAADALTRALMPIDEQAFSKKDRANAQVNDALLSAYLNEPEKVQFTEDAINEGGNYVDRLEEQQEDLAKATASILSVEAIPQEVVEEAEADISKPNWWKFAGNGSFQLSQNYISDNWYKGGESNIAGIATLQLKADYNDNEKVQWENLFDAKLGIASAPSDQYHDYLVNTDLLRLYSKFGLQAAKHWYYTISGEAKTQFMESYGANSMDMKAAFLAPLDVNVSLGMDYKLEKPTFKFSVMIAPLTWTMRYIGNDNVDKTNYGWHKDNAKEMSRNTMHNIGSELLPSLTWNIAKNISFESRLDYLTSYTWVRIDWENTLNFAVNKYLSTKLYVHARYDDVSNKHSSEGLSYYQLNELFSFGINYTW